MLHTYQRKQVPGLYLLCDKGLMKLCLKYFYLSGYLSRFYHSKLILQVDPPSTYDCQIQKPVQDDSLALRMALSGGFGRIQVGILVGKDSMQRMAVWQGRESFLRVLFWAGSLNTCPSSCGNEGQTIFNNKTITWRRSNFRNDSLRNQTFPLTVERGQTPDPSCDPVLLWDRTFSPKLQAEWD